MNIRSITAFANIGALHTQAQTVQEAGELAHEVKRALEATRFPVQTTRMATQPLSDLPGDPLQLAGELGPLCAEAGFDFFSLGPVLADTRRANLNLLYNIPELIRTTEAVFCGVLVGRAREGINLRAIQHTAKIVHEIAHTTDLGFGNLRLAMLANVGPHAPFFPAAYHDGGPPAIAIATEAAQLAVYAFDDAPSLHDAEMNLITSVAISGQRIAEAVRPLAERHGFRFAGIDFSLAPFPEQVRSIGDAIERLGVDRFGAPGTLFVASLLTECLRQADYPHCGFNGLMLPVLEDATMAARSREGLFTVNDLLLWSAVCGTGLDTVPLPGDVSVDELAGILLDVATLAQRLNKPLTARLMPIPGAQAGDLTEFDFEYFANARVLDVKNAGSPGLFALDDWLTM